MPITLLLKPTAAFVPPLQTTWFAGTLAIGVGFTVILKVVAVPAQPLAVGVIVMVAVTGISVLLVAVNALISPIPFAAKPIEVLLFVQV